MRISQYLNPCCSVLAARFSNLTGFECLHRRAAITYTHDISHNECKRPHNASWKISNLCIENKCHHLTLQNKFRLLLNKGVYACMYMCTLMFLILICVCISSSFHPHNHHLSPNSPRLMLLFVDCATVNKVCLILSYLIVSLKTNITTRLYRSFVRRIHSHRDSEAESFSHVIDDCWVPGDHWFGFRSSINIIIPQADCCISKTEPASSMSDRRSHVWMLAPVKVTVTLMICGGHAPFILIVDSSPLYSRPRTWP